MSQAFQGALLRRVASRTLQESDELHQIGRFPDNLENFESLFSTHHLGLRQGVL